jgi:hypothetical protein
LKELEDENLRLKKGVDDQALDIHMLRGSLKKVLTPEAKRMAVKHFQERFWQNRQSICGLIGLSTSTWHYKPKPNENDTILQRLRDLAV